MFNITSIGEILWDVYPEEKRIGGAPFNFIYHIKKIIGNGNFISSVGNDEDGKDLTEFLSNNNFDITTIFIDKDHPTGKVLVTLNENKIPQFKMSSTASFDFLQFTEIAKKIIEESDLIYFGTFTSRSEVSRKTIQSILNIPNKKYFCDLNLRHNFYTIEFIEQALITSNVLKINEDEFFKLQNILGLSKNFDSGIQGLISKYKIDLLAVTMGEKGSKLFTQRDYHFYSQEKIEVIDTLGAGDAFSAILCLCYLLNFPLEKTNHLANSFAAEVCKTKGAITTDDIYSKFQKYFIN
ncbi:MAG: PfkB family carbohydrate kinase [Melioribacteraceae bacterium]|nr:PfkB family carbohydrate kinase [Melioribacteraceae bacterium]